jgi:hypothetical protein
MYVPTSHIDQVFSATRLNNKQQLEVILQTFIKNVRLENNCGTGGFQVTKKFFFVRDASKVSTNVYGTGKELFEKKKLFRKCCNNRQVLGTFSRIRTWVANGGDVE